MSEAIFGIRTKYFPDDLNAFKADIENLRKTIGDIRKISGSSGGFGAAVKSVRSFVGGINNIKGDSIQTLERVGRAMSNIARASEEAANVSGDLRVFAREIREIGKANVEQKGDWEAGRKSIQKMSSDLRELVTVSGPVSAIAKSMASLFEIVQTQPGPLSIIQQLRSLDQVVTWTDSIRKNLKAISDMGLKVQYGGGPGGEGGGAGGGGSGRSVYPGIPVAVPSSSLGFRSDALQAASEKAVREALGSAADTSTMWEKGEKSVQEFLTRMMQIEGRTLEEAELIYRQFAKIHGHKKELGETEQAFTNRMRDLYERQYSKAKGTLTATGLAQIMVPGGAPMAMGGGGTAGAMARYRGTLMHEAMSGFFQQMVPEGGGYLKPPFANMMMKLFDKDVQAELGTMIKAQGDLAVKEFERTAAQAQITDKKWLAKQVQEIRRGVDRNIRNTLEFLYNEIMQRYRGQMRKGIRELQLFSEKTMADIKLISPRGVGGPPLLKRTPAELKPYLKSAIKNLRFFGDDEAARALMTHIDTFGLKIAGTADLMAKIGGKGIIMDLKTGEESLDALHALVLQVKEFYGRGMKGMFPGLGVIRGYKMDIQGTITSIEQAEAKIRAASGRAASMKVTPLPGESQPQYESRQFLANKEKQIALKEKAKALGEEEIRMEEEHLAKQKEKEKVARQIVEAKKSEAEVTQSIASVSKEALSSDSRRAAIAGGGAGGMGGGRGGDGDITARFALAAGIAPPTEEMTRFERIMNKIYLDARAFGKEMDATSASTELVTSSVKRQSDVISRLVKIESVRNSEIFKQQEAHEKLTSELAEYEALSRKVVAREKQRAAILAKVGGESGWEQLRTRMTRLEQRGGVLTPEQDLARKQYAKTRAELYKLDAAAEYAEKGMKEFETALVNAMRSSEEPTARLEKQLWALLKPLGLVDKEVKDMSQAYNMFNAQSRDMMSGIVASKEATQAFDVELKRHRDIEKQVTDGKKLHKLELGELSVLNKAQQKQHSLISARLNQLSEQQLKYTEMQSKGIALNKKQSAQSERLGKEYARLSKRLENLSSRQRDVTRLTRLHTQSSEQLRGDLRTTFLGFKNMLKSQAAWVLGYGVMFGVLRKFTDALGSVIALQQQMSRALRTGRSEIMSSALIMEEYSDAAETAMIRVGVGAEETGEVLYQLGSAGLTAEESLAALQSTMDAIVGTEADVTEYTKSVAGVYNNFAETITHVTDLQKKFKYINDIMVGTFRDHQVEINELTEGLKHLSASGKASHIEFKQMAGILGTLNDHMIKSGIAGRSVQSILSRISRQGREFAKAFDIEIDMTRPLDFIKILEDVNEKMGAGEITAEQVGTIFERLGLRGAKSFIVLVENVDELNENILTLETQSEDAAEAMKDIMMATPEAAINRLTQAFAHLAREIFGTYVQLGQFLITEFVEFTTSIHESEKANKQLADTVYRLISVFLGLAATFYIVRAAVSFFNESISIANKSLMSLKTLGIIGVITVLTVAIYHFIEARRRSADLTRQLAELNKEFSKMSTEIDTNINRYERLLQAKKDMGVKTNEEMARLYPELIEGYNEENEAIITTNEILKEKIRLLKETIEAQIESQRIEFEEEIGPKMIKLFREEIEKTRTAIGEYRRDLKEASLDALKFTDIRKTGTAPRYAEGRLREEYSRVVNIIERIRRAEEGGVPIYAERIREKYAEELENFRNNVLTTSYLGGEVIGEFQEATIDELEKMLEEAKSNLYKYQLDMEKTARQIRSKMQENISPELMEDFKRSLEDVNELLAELSKLTGKPLIFRREAIRESEKEFRDLATSILSYRRNIEDAFDLMDKPLPEGYKTIAEEFGGLTGTALRDAVADSILEGLDDAREKFPEKFEEFRMEGFKIEFAKAELGRLRELAPEYVVKSFYEYLARIEKDRLLQIEQRRHAIAKELGLLGRLAGIEALRFEDEKDRVELARRAVEFLGKNKEQLEAMGPAGERIIELFREWVSLEMEEVEVREQGQRLLEQSEETISRIAEKVRGLRIGAMTDGLGKDISAIMDKWQKAIESSRRTMTRTADQMRKQGTMFPGGKDQAEVMAKTVERFYKEEIKLSEKLRDREIIEKRITGMIELDRELEDLEYRYDKLTLEADVYLSVEEQIALKELELKETVRGVTRELADKRLELKRMQRDLEINSDRIERLQKNLAEGLLPKVEVEAATKELEILSKALPGQKEDIANLQGVVKFLENILDLTKQNTNELLRQAELEIQIQSLSRKAAAAELRGAFGEAGRFRSLENFASKMKQIEKDLAEDIIDIHEAKIAKLYALERKRFDDMKAAIEGSKKGRDEYIEDLSIMGQHTLEFGVKAERGFSRVTETVKGMGYSLRAGIESSLLSMQGLGQEIEKIGSTIGTGFEEIITQTITRPDEEISKTKGEIKGIRKELDELSKKRRQTGLTDEEIQKYQDLNEELRRQQRLLDKMKDPMERAKKAWKDLGDAIIKEINRMIARMIVFFIWKQLTGLFTGGGDTTAKDASMTSAGGTVVPSFGGGGAEIPGQGISYRIKQGGFINMAGKLVNMAHMQHGGVVPARAWRRSGLIIGGQEGRDSVPIMAMPGEYFVRKDLVRYYGLNFFRALEKREIIKAQNGGYVNTGQMNYIPAGDRARGEDNGGGNNYFFIQTNDVDSFRRLLEANGETISDISLGAMYRDVDENGVVSRKIESRR